MVFGHKFKAEKNPTDMRDGNASDFFVGHTFIFGLNSIGSTCFCGPALVDDLLFASSPYVQFISQRLHGHVKGLKLTMHIGRFYQISHH